MGLFVPRTFPTIFSDMLATLLSRTAITDLNYGSVFTTLLEAAAQEDDEQYFQMLEIIRGYRLDTTSGDDLENRAFEYGLTRLDAQLASTKVVIGDSSITKVSTTVYAGLPGALAGSQSINAVSDAGFTAFGHIIIGRGTARVEKVQYWSITNNTNYYTFNLGSGSGSPSSLANDHGTEETIILAQGGTSRVVAQGTEIKVPSSDLLEEVSFALATSTEILEGESVSEEVLVFALEAGAKANVPIGAIREFSAIQPFADATVTNPYRVTNGADLETDNALRDRIRDYVQSLSRGTLRSIRSGVLGLTSSDNKRVVSATPIDATVPTDIVKLFIDDGTGFIPTYDHVGYELISQAVGGERFLSVDNTPIVKAFVETQSLEPYNIPTFLGVAGATGVLDIEVGGVSETIEFVKSDFRTDGSATAQEVLTKINSASRLAEARATGSGKGLRIFSRSLEDDIKVLSSNANAALGFPFDKKQTLNLYLIRDGITTRLSKDGKTASVQAQNTGPYTFAGDQFLSVAVDRATDNTNVIKFSAGAFSVADVVAYINERVSGLIASESSAGTRLSLSSGTVLSSGSKIQILDTFDAVYYDLGALPSQIGSLDVDEAPMTLFSEDGNYLYVGSHTKFNTIWFNAVQVSSANIFVPQAFVSGFSYSTGNGWAFMYASDETQGFQGGGRITFWPPNAWAKATYQGIHTYWIRIGRQEPNAIQPPIGHVKISNANTIFGFPTDEVSGEDKDFTLNRFIGQIEMTSPLQAGDEIVAGLSNDEVHDARAAVFSLALPSGVEGITGTTLSIESDGTSRSVSFTGADFASSTATPLEIAEAINNRNIGATASVFGGKLRLRTNRVIDGSIEVLDGGSNSVLGFSTTEVENFISNQPAIVSGATGNLVFDADDSLVILVDGDDSDVGLVIPVYHEASLTQIDSTTLLRDSSLSATFPDDEMLVGYKVEMTSGLYSGWTGAVSGYDHSIGQITVSPAFPPTSANAATLTLAALGITDLVLTAQTAGLTGNNIEVSVSTMWGGYQIVTIYDGQTEETYNTSLWDGVDSSDQGGQTIGDLVAGINANSALVTATGALVYRNEFSLGTYSLSGGYNAAQAPSVSDKIQLLPRSTQALVEFWNNANISAEINILNSLAEIVLLSDTSVQIASLTTGENASILVSGGQANSKLYFATTKVIGVDAYRHFTGLAREVQWKIDGRLSDQANYPGIRAAGTQIEVLEPIRVPVVISINVKTMAGSSLAVISNEIKSSISNYINNLETGADVILSEVIVVTKRVSGVFDVEVESINNVADNLVITDKQLARIVERDILVKGS